MRRDLRVVEIFGPTIQGEGPSLGQCAAFVRLADCTLACAWCDTAWSWDWRRYDRGSESVMKSPEEIWEELSRINAGLIVITGGEPLLQQDRLVWLADRCRAAGRRVEIETSGTVLPTHAIVGAARNFNVSVKLTNSGMPEKRRIHEDVIHRFVSCGRVAWKFVVRSVTDLDEIAELQARYGLEPIWVMPEGVTDGTIMTRMRDLADAVTARGWNLTPRLHILLWGDERGR